MVVRENLRVLEGGEVWAAGRHVRLHGRLVLVAAGKAAGRMAGAARKILGRRLEGGIVVGTTTEVRVPGLEHLAGGHPVPNAASARAGARVLALAGELGADDTLLVLLSGGASALRVSPAGDGSLADKMEVTRALLAAGAPIGDVNTVRKHLSLLKGGGLARAAFPARVLTLALSDVVGSDLSTIASGPTVPDPTTYDDALAVLARHRLLSRVPGPVRRHLQRGARQATGERPKPRDPAFRNAHARVVGDVRLCLRAAATEARRRGFRTHVLTAPVVGEARHAATRLVSILAAHTRGGRGPVCVLAGGETTVTVRGSGRGGRNQELAVAAMRPLATLPYALLATLATDGVDGPTPAAGGVVDSFSLPRAASLGWVPESVLRENDSYRLLTALGDTLLTGPTGTNVADLVLLLLLGARRK